MTSESFWGEIEEVDVTPPLVHLREQAGKLGQATKGILEGRVYQVSHDLSGDRLEDGRIAFNPDVVAPALDGYSYTVMQISHSVNPYPVWVATPGVPESSPWKCADEGAFLAALHQVLSSPEVKRVIASLLTQSKALR